MVWSSPLLSEIEMDSSRLGSSNGTATFNIEANIKPIQQDNNVLNQVFDIIRYPGLPIVQ